MAQLLAAGPFETEGERRAAEVLKQLPADWVVICNKVLPHGDRSHEIDFIVIGDRWVFLLDEKSWKGKIHGNDQLWVRSDGFSLPSPLTKADYVAKILAGHLSWKVTPLKSSGYFVRGGVLLSLAERMPQIHDSRATNGLYLLSNVCERLQMLDSQGGNPQVGQLRSYIQKALVDLSQRPQVPQRINTILIEDAVAIRPGVRLFNGKLEGSQDKAIQLMVYDLTRDPVNAQSLYDFYMREYRALGKLDGTGLVPMVNVPFKWSEDFLIVPILPPRGKFLSVMPSAETSEEFVQELLLAAACFGRLTRFMHMAFSIGQLDQAQSVFSPRSELSLPIFMPRGLMRTQLLLRLMHWQLKIPMPRSTWLWAMAMPLPRLIPLVWDWFFWKDLRAPRSLLFAQTSKAISFFHHNHAG